MKYKIALTSSGPLSGKSTLAKYLENEHGFYIVDHSSTLVKSYVEAWNQTFSEMGLPITVEDVYRNKEVHRQALQEHGDNIGFNGRRMFEWVGTTVGDGGGRNIVFDSFRGEAQAQVLRDLGFMLVQLKITEDVRRERAETMGKDYDKIVESMNKRPDLELGIEHPHLTLDGTLPPEVQTKILWVSYSLFDAARKRKESGQDDVQIFGSTIQPHG